MNFKARFAFAALCCAAVLQTTVHAQTTGASLLEKPLSELLKQVNSKVTGDLPTEQTLNLNLSLPLRNQDQLAKFLADVSDPQSKSYHHYLSPNQFIAQYSPAQSDYDLLVQWAEDKGLTVTETPANRNYVSVQGSVGTINSVFHVALKNFVDLDTNRQFFGPQQEPTPLTPVPLLGITGLDTITPKIHHSQRGSGTVVANGGGSGPGGTFTPTNIRSAYYPQGSLNGSGQAVSVFSFDGYQTSDLNLYYQQLGISQPVYVSNVLVNGYSGACTDVVHGTSTCDDGEQIIDIAAVAGMAPSLGTIYFYEGTSATNILNRMVSDNYASVISSSWSGGDFGNSSESIFQQMQAQGMTYLNASGDGGAYTSYSSNPLPPALSPSITQVGGTSLTTSGGNYVSESGWRYSGGGWLANTFSRPSFQQNAITAANGGSTSWRNGPDVSAEGDYDNLAVDNGSVYYNYGGTSFAAPRWAGLIAMVNQQANANCEAPTGFIAPTLYSVLNTGNYGNIFHDVTSGNNSSGSVSYNSVANYDLVTGLGSPTGQNLINLLAPLHSSPTATSISMSHSTGRPTTFSAHVSSSGGAAISSGSVSFSYSLYGNTTQACSASVVNGNASCTVNVNTQTNQYTLYANYSGNTSQYPNGCAASSTSQTAIGTGYSFN